MFTPRIDAFTIATSEQLSQRVIGKNRESQLVSATPYRKDSPTVFLVAEEERLKRLYDTYCSLKGSVNDKEYKKLIKDTFLKEFVLTVGSDSKSNGPSISSLYDQEQNGIKKMLKLLAEFRKTPGANARDTAAFKMAFSEFIKIKLGAANKERDINENDESITQEVTSIPEPKWLEDQKKVFREQLAKLKESERYPDNKALAKFTEACEDRYRFEFIETMTKMRVETCRDIANQFTFLKLMALLDEFSTPDKFKLDQHTFKSDFKLFLLKRCSKPKPVAEEKALPAMNVIPPVVDAPSFFSWGGFKRAFQRFASWVGSLLSGFHSENRIQHPTSPLPNNGQQAPVRTPEQSRPSSYKTLAEHGLVLESEEKSLLFAPSSKTTSDWLGGIVCYYEDQLAIIRKVSRVHANELECLNKQSFLLETTDFCDSRLLSLLSLEELFASLTKFSTPSKIELDKPEFQKQFYQFLREKYQLHVGMGIELSEPDLRLTASSARSRI